MCSVNFLHGIPVAIDQFRDLSPFGVQCELSAGYTCSHRSIQGNSSGGPRTHTVSVYVNNQPITMSESKSESDLCNINTLSYYCRTQLHVKSNSPNLKNPLPVSVATKGPFGVGPFPFGHECTIEYIPFQSSLFWPEKKTTKHLTFSTISSNQTGLTHKDIRHF